MKNSQKKIGKESMHLYLQAIYSEMWILLLLLLEFHVSYANKDTGEDKCTGSFLLTNMFTHSFIQPLIYSINSSITKFYWYLLAEEHGAWFVDMTR